MNELAIVEHYYNENLTDVSVWGPEVFDVKTLAPTALAITGLRECATLCKLETNPCNGFVYIEPTCYLTYSLVNSNIVTGITGSYPWYTRLCKC